MYIPLPMYKSRLYTEKHLYARLFDQVSQNFLCFQPKRRDMYIKVPLGEGFPVQARLVRGGKATVWPSVHRVDLWTRKPIQNAPVGPSIGPTCTFLILVDSDWSLPLKEVDSGLTLLLV